jgi:hypothetical protein
MILRNGQVIVLYAVSANGRAHNEAAHVAKCPYGTHRVFRSEADHIYGGVEFFFLHRGLKSATILAIAND